MPSMVRDGAAKLEKKLIKSKLHHRFEYRDKGKNHE